MKGQRERIVVSEDGLSLPVIEVLTGRGVIFGKSGSGKSNSASVIVEELLEKGFPLLIIDIEGEYFTLRDRYDIVHVGDGDRFDHKLFETDPDRIVDFCIDQNRPVIVDISDVLEIDRAHKIIEDTLTVLFSREKSVQQPFLVIVEEIHEFLPQQGGLDDLGETLIRIAKRGRKRGLGLCGMSQRPAAVDKDFITQCDWIVWHRLTWENDTRVVKSILGSDTAKEVQELDTGEAVMMTDWDETVRRVKFRRKRTADAGDTPTLSPADRRDLTNPAPESSTESSGSVDRSEEISRDQTATDVESRGGQGNGNIVADTYPSTLEEAARTVHDDTADEEPASEDDIEVVENDSKPVSADGTGDGNGMAEASHTDPAVNTLWELGQFVTFVLVKAFNSLVYGTRFAVAKATGKNEPVDRLGPISAREPNTGMDPSRWTIRIVSVLVAVIVVLVLVAVFLF